MNESEFYQRKVKKYLESYGIWFSRVEFDLFPDLVCVDDGVTFLAEMKVVPKKSKVIRVPWRRGQLAWLRDYVKHGGLAILYLLVENEFYAISELSKVYKYADIQEDRIMD